MNPGRQILRGGVAAALLFTTGRVRAAVTFTHDVAPVVFAHCAPCHRPGQGGPFPLLTFADCRKHATDLAGVTVPFAVETSGRFALTISEVTLAAKALGAAPSCP